MNQERPRGHLSRARTLSRHANGVAEPRDFSASPADGAMLNCFGEVTKYTLSPAAGRSKFELLRTAAAAWPAWIELVRENGSGAFGLERHEGTTVVVQIARQQVELEPFSGAEGSGHDNTERNNSRYGSGYDKGASHEASSGCCPGRQPSDYRNRL